MFRLENAPAVCFLLDTSTTAGGRQKISVAGSVALVGNIRQAEFLGPQGWPEPTKGFRQGHDGDHQTGKSFTETSTPVKVFLNTPILLRTISVARSSTNQNPFLKLRILALGWGWGVTESW